MVKNVFGSETMQKRLFWWQLGGFVFTSLGGILLHYLYELTGKSTVAAAISGVNESTWEHMKLLFFPLLIFALIQSRCFKEKSFWCVKLFGTLLGLTLIPVLFYTANGAFGKTPDWYNISTFFISAAAVFAAEGFLFKKGINCKHPWITVTIFILIAAAFVAFTFNTPQLPLFKDPLSGRYGII